MVGRDTDAPGASQAPLRPRSGSSASSSASFASSSAFRDRQEELAAWRARRDEQQRSAAPTRKPSTPPKPRPFRASGSHGPSDEEKQLLLQKRRELMRSPMKPIPLPQRPKKPEAAASTTPTSSVASGSSSTDSHEYATTPTPPPPRTPPRRGAHQDVHRADRRAPAPPQTPPLAPRPHAANAARSRLALARGQHSQRLAPPRVVVTKEPEHSPTSSASRLGDDPLIETLDNQRDHDRDMPPLVLHPDESTSDLDDTSSPLYTSRPVLTSSEKFVQPEDTDEALTIDQLTDASPGVADDLPIIPPLVLSPRQDTEPNNERVSSPVSEVGRHVYSSPRKQVRFAVAGDAQSATNAEVGHHLSVEEDSSFTDLHDSADAARGNPLTDSQSSLEREMKDHEQLMSEVDELIHHRTDSVIVTDRVLHRDKVTDGHAEIEETVTTSRTDDTSSSHIIEETDARDISSSAEVFPSVNVDDMSEEGGLTGEAVSGGDDQVKRGPIDAIRHDEATRGHQDSEFGPPSSGATLRVAKAPSADHRIDGSSPVVSSPGPSRHRLIRLRNVVIFILLSTSFIALDLLFPRSPVSRGLRVMKRLVLGLTSYVVSRTAVWTWRALIEPGSRSLSNFLAASNPWLEPQAKALQSLVVLRWDGLRTIAGRLDLKELKQLLNPAFGNLEKFCRGPANVGFRVVKSISNGVSSRIADAVLFVFAPFTRPVPSIDPESTAAAQDRLQQLVAAQQQLRLKVKDLMRTQEEWALAELERMKQRRVDYTTATKEILAETTKVMLKAVEDAKLSATEHIQSFTSELARELMSSIQPVLEEYARSEADEASQQALSEKVEVEDAAHLDALHVDSVKHQGESALREEIANDRKSIVVEVDVIKVVETVRETVTTEVDSASKTVADSFKDAIDDVKTIAEAGKADLETVVSVAENVIERAELQFVEDAVDSLKDREDELRRGHDVAQAEIARLTSEELGRLQNERTAAEELARATVVAEEAVIRVAEQAQRALDAQLESGKEKLELEVEKAAHVAVNIEMIEVERIVVEEEVVKEFIEAHVVEETEELVRDIDQVGSDIMSEVDMEVMELSHHEQIPESTLIPLAQEEVQRLEKQQTEVIVMLDSVAGSVEHEIASEAGIMPLQEASLNENIGDELSSKVNVASRQAQSIVEETERRHMVILSVGFVVLALMTAFVLYPRWRRLIANPSKDAKAMSVYARRRRRRWQRPAQVSDSEPEEVTLLQTGTSSDDGLSETNEPEPEIVEQMSGDGTSQPSYALSTRTSYTSYTQALDYSARNEPLHEEDEEEERFVTPLPTLRALRHRRR